MSPITPKSPSAILDEYKNKLSLPTISGGFISGLTDDLNVIAIERWLNEAFASVIRYAAEVALPEYDRLTSIGVDGPNADKVIGQTRGYNMGTKQYYDSLLSLAESLRQKDV